jgi:hypothetical protein
MTHLQVLEEVPDSRLNIQRVQPQCKHPSLPLSLCVKVLDLRWCFGLFEGSKSRMVVEQIGHECEIEFWVTRDERVGSQESSTTDLVGIVEDLLGTFVNVGSLKGCFRALFRFELIQ